MPEPLRVLRLGNSLDFLGDLPAGTRAWEVAQAMLEAETGRAVETIVKRTWPSPALSDILERWIGQLRPHILVICVSSFWVETETLSGRFNQFGRAGRTIADASRKASLKPIVAERGLYHLGRRLLLATLGGRPAYTPAQIEAWLEGWLRTACRHEDLGIAVVGTPFSPDTMARPPARERATRRKDDLRERLARLCGRLKVHHVLPPHGPDAFSSDLRLADRVHFNELAHARMGAIDGAAMIAVWRAMNPSRDGTGATPA